MCWVGLFGRKKRKEGASVSLHSALGWLIKSPPIPHFFFLFQQTPPPPLHRIYLLRLRELRETRKTLASMAAEEDAAAAIVDSDVWLACAVPLSRLPAVGSQVYYFPHGHAEQCPAPLPAALPTPHLFPCIVTAVSLAADAKTNEVYANISLQPGPHRGAAASASSADAGASNSVSYFAKQLTQSDANNGGGFSVPRYCADFIFPKLDFEADPPVQTLVMRDPRGDRWQFRHIYRGTPRRHLLTTGWSKFVNAKLLVAGDTVVFMRRPDGELLIGLRRAPRYPRMMQQQGAALHNARARVPPDHVMEAARLAAEGSPFTVAYYPRLGAGEFVVPRKEVEDALACAWEPGMLVRMQVMEAEDARRTDWASGTVKQLHAHMWRALEVGLYFFFFFFSPCHVSLAFFFFFA